MNISCPSCHTVFRVDPARIPPAGIRARCSRCGATFPVQRPDGGATPEAIRNVELAAPLAAAESAADGAGETRTEPAAATSPGAATEAETDTSSEVPATPAPHAAPDSPAAAVSAASGETGSEASTAVAEPANTTDRDTVARTDEPDEDTATAAAPANVDDTSSRDLAGAAPATEPRPQIFGSRDPDARAKRIARALVSDIIAYHPKRWESSRDGSTLRAEFRDEIMKSWEEYVAQVGLELAKSTPHFRGALNDILASGRAIF